MSASNVSNWVQGGREFSAEEIKQIRETVSWLPGLARGELAATVCEHLEWHTAAGTPKIQACEKLLEKLEAAGLIELPTVERKKVPTVKRAGIVLSERTATISPLSCPLRDIEPVHLEMATDANEVELWNEYVERFHPLGYKGAFGYRQRYFIRSGSLYLGCVLLAGAAKAIAVRDRWIGWDKQVRLHNLPWVINNTRFLIFPHIRIPHLASHVLGQLARRVAADWHGQWGFSPLLMETFVDPRQFAGTCYRAAGWKLLGETTGRGLARPGRRYHSSPRLILVKSLDKDFRHLLGTEPLSGGQVQ